MLVAALAATILITSLSSNRSHAGGVTLITHGLNGNVDGWVNAMANSIPGYYRLPGTNFTCYKMYFYPSGGSYYLTASHLAGLPPASPQTGEIVVELDWSQLSDGNSYNTYQIAAAVAPALLDPNFIGEMGGHALAELPLHLVGHSRGGSLICELSRLLGTNGVWVDHLTTLDPHPLNNDGFNWDALLYSAVDAPARTYASVLFHDNCYQKLDFAINGEPVAGAYVRKLTSLSGGYTSTHSDVHLWYHGTLALNTPTSYVEDGATVTITSTMRSNWWTTYEQSGSLAGFYYGLIGGGDRLSSDQPVGPGFPAIRDGYNQWWDLGAGQTANRTALTNNHGLWPSLIKVNRTDTGPLAQGQSAGVKFYYQWPQPATAQATLSIYLDDDFNPLNSNQRLLQQISLPGTDASNIAFSTVVVPLSVTNAAIGWHAVLAEIASAGQHRYLYAPEVLQVLSAPRPTLDIAQLDPVRIQVGLNAANGQTLILQTSSDLLTWQSEVTNTLSSSRWNYIDSVAEAALPRFYRAVLAQ